MEWMKHYEAILIGNGTMGGRHRSRFESCGVHFSQVLDLEAPQWIVADPNPGIDFVVIASPASTHYEYAKFFLAKNIPVFVEKPLAVNGLQARELVELAERNRTTLFVAQSECFNPIFLNFRTHFVKELNLLAKEGGSQSVRMEFCREHGYTERCRDVDVALDILVHDLSMFLTMFPREDVEVVRYDCGTDRAVMKLKVARGRFAGVEAEFIADRNSPRDVRTISVDFGSDACRSEVATRNSAESSYVVSLARYMANGEIAHIPDSLDNEHHFFLKLLAGACQDWGRRAARIAAQVVELATSNSK